MSFREKLAWISLVSITGFAGFYFWSIGYAPPTKGHPVATLFSAVVALIVVQTVLSIAVAIHKPKEAQAPRDERDKLIDLKSARIAYSGLVSAIAVACFLEAIAPSITYNANGLLFILVTVELLRLLSQIIQYRRSA
jgi:hypothetical protein